MIRPKKRSSRASDVEHESSCGRGLKFPQLGILLHYEAQPLESAAGFRFEQREMSMFDQRSRIGRRPSTIQFDVSRFSASAKETALIDEGLRAHMNKVYGLMSAAMLITGLVAYLVGTNELLLVAIFGSPLKWVVMLAPLGVVFLFAASINRLSVGAAQAVFWGFAALMGLSISYIFAAYTGFSIAQTFLVTAIAFAGLSLYGYTTKRDLSGWGSFLIMGLIGLIVAGIVNIFLASPAIMFAISALGVLIFAGLTAYDTQNIKNTYLQMAYQGEGIWLQKAAIMGALSLYLNFLNMFMMLLYLFGQRE